MAGSSDWLEVAPTSITFGCGAVAHQTVDITKTVPEKGAFVFLQLLSFCDIHLIY